MTTKNITEVVYNPHNRGVFQIKVPVGWCVRKDEINGDQTKALQYRDFHRCGDILGKYITYNPKVHKSEIFALNGLGGI